MEIISINQIGKLRDEIKSQLEKIDLNQYKDATFGNENEYTFKGLIGGLESILTDINALITHPKYFIKHTTYDERGNIREYLANCLHYLNNPSYLYRYIDNLKTLLRPLQLRNSRLRAVAFSNEIDEIVRRKQEIDVFISEVKKNKKQIEAILSSVIIDKDRSGEKLSEFDQLYNDLEDKKREVENNIHELEKRVLVIEKTSADITSKHDEVIASYQEVKSNEKVVETFSKNVQNREKQLGFIEASTKEYLSKIQEFTTERVNLLEEANNLIDSAKQALNYKTAEGLSASFKTQYDEEINSKPSIWMKWALGCLAVALGLGIWILVDDKKEIEIIIGRIALIPLPIAGAIFCANQYIKRQNIIQDYAYKMVLAKSIVGFSEQFKKLGTDNAEYLMYLKKAIDEIHQDPLRKRAKNEEDEVKVDNKLKSVLTDFVKEFKKAS